jgi:enterobactin synthetase component D
VMLVHTRGTSAGASEQIGAQVVPSPGLLPEFIAGATVRWSSDFPIDDWQLPPELHRAVPRRKQEFVAGRCCAARAIQQLRPGPSSVHVGRGSAGEPLWPAGFTGSITHTANLASATAARLSDVRSIGIDSESLITPARASAIESAVMVPAEYTVGGSALEAATRVTLVFSAKEAIFKCLYPLVRRLFFYTDVSIASADVRAGTFVAKVIHELGVGFEEHTILHGRFVIDEPYVHTAVWLPAGCEVKAI